MTSITRAHINIIATGAQSSSIELLDINGRKMVSKPIHLSAGNNALSLNHLHQYGKGTYFIKIFADGENHFQKIIIK
ncbi:T9SS type A sorting domain-containing protein [Niastella vici]|uniref:T9SS type A sorting domain-containing protein n=1 Tax=Niastella vici TaxID=1703345 RepID=UPI0009C14A5D|nr:T9SS type A sorting domain-containing protein [Niastella vici]